MTGGVRFEHEEKTWPPKYWKLQILFTLGDKKVQFGFKDPRRIARLRLVQEPLTSEPISRLGFDPILSMPSFEAFCDLVGQRSVPLKVLLLDQSFSAGVGNWVADEVLYQSKIHPAQYSHTLTQDELRTLYNVIQYVCQTAVDVEADEEKFPSDWLMKYRWNKGRGLGKGILPDGQVLKFETIGGRTTAYSPSRQVLRMTEDMKKRFKRKVAMSIKKETILSEKTNRQEVVCQKVTKKKTVKKEVKDEDDLDFLLPPEKTKVVRNRCTTNYNLRQIR
ncbi:hypothetical protein BY458DRAFT_527774 [Sporodiniella umbellata]|nr:hypothetical protein BY458DRAFT_527774 [Sporodiniella umbellata]